MNQTSPQTVIEGISRGIKAPARYVVAATSLVAVQRPFAGIDPGHGTQPVAAAPGIHTPSPPGALKPSLLQLNTANLCSLSL
jgi:hypothetical protein